MNEIQFNWIIRGQSIRRPPPCFSSETEGSIFVDQAQAWRICPALRLRRANGVCPGAFCNFRAWRSEAQSLLLPSHRRKWHMGRRGGVEWV